MKKPLIVIFMVLLIDQIIKIYVKTHFFLGEEVDFLGLSWFKIHFIENKGMAFGMSFGENVGKILLTTLRVVLASGIMWYLIKMVKKGTERPIMIYSFALIFAGAVGNIIDSLFYGLVFSQSTFFHVATFMPADGGYAPMLLGKVVDMFYFPLIDTDLPAWLPFVGGKHFSFFDAIFNFADAAITCGVVLLFFALYLKNKDEEKKKQSLAAQTDND